MSWVEENLRLLTDAFPALEHTEEGGVTWVHLPVYEMPDGWSPATVELAFRIPSQAGEAPYGFWLRPAPTAPGGTTPGSYSYPATTPWGGDWGQFSFAIDQPWTPAPEAAKGPNLLRFARAIGDRLKEGR